MKFPMPREYKHIRPIDTVWYGNPQLKEGLSVPEITIKYGSLSSCTATPESIDKAGLQSNMVVYPHE